MPFYQAKRLIYERLIHEQAQPDPFNKGRFLKEPRGLICDAIVNQPLGLKLIGPLDMLQPSKLVSIPVQ